VVNRLGRSFRSDLRLTDRVYWRQTLAIWRAAGACRRRGRSRWWP